MSTERNRKTITQQTASKRTTALVNAKPTAVLNDILAQPATDRYSIKPPATEVSLPPASTVVSPPQQENKLAKYDALARAQYGPLWDHMNTLGKQTYYETCANNELRQQREEKAARRTKPSRSQVANVMPPSLPENMSGRTFVPPPIPNQARKPPIPVKPRTPPFHEAYGIAPNMLPKGEPTFKISDLECDITGSMESLNEDNAHRLSQETVSFTTQRFMDDVQHRAQTPIHEQQNQHFGDALTEKSYAIKQALSGGNIQRCTEAAAQLANMIEEFDSAGVFEARFEQPSASLSDAMVAAFIDSISSNMLANQTDYPHTKNAVMRFMSKYCLDNVSTSQ